jgi:hypothetical protein
VAYNPDPFEQPDDNDGRPYRMGLYRRRRMEITDEQIITTSRMKAYNACRRLHHLKYELGYRPVEDREASEFGTIFHAGLEAWYLAFAKGVPLLALQAALEALVEAAKGATHFDEVSAAKAELLMIGYHARWADSMAEFQVIAVERKFTTHLPVPANAKRARGLRVAGKIDVLVRKLADGTNWNVEHKTTTADLTPGSTYWQRLRMDTQVSVYFEGAESLGYPLTGCLYDVISKPQQRPYKATPVEQRKYTKEKRDKAGNITEPSRLYANLREFDETMDEFKGRMAAEIAAAPEAFFQRPEVVRLESELDASRRDTYETALMMRDTGNKGMAPRNPDACHMYGRACDFYEVCCGAAELEDESKFKRLDTVHPELAE